MEEKRIKRFLNILIAISVALLFIALFLSIFTDGLGVAIAIIFPFSLLILSVLIIALVKGIRNRKIVKRWYLKCFAILCVGLFLWSPLLKPTRKYLERKWRMSSREQVVEDIKSGKLMPENGFFVVPFEEYGRVSFKRIFTSIEEQDNVVSFQSYNNSSLSISFVANSGFFGSKDIVMYIEDPDEYIINNEDYYQIDDNWFAYRQSFSLF